MDLVVPHHEVDDLVDEAIGAGCGISQLQRPLPLIIDDLVASGRWPFISGELLSSPDLCRILAGMGLQPPRTQALRGILVALGYRPLGRVTVEGLSRRYWSRRPELFTRPSGLPDTTAIRRLHLTNRRLDVSR